MIQPLIRRPLLGTALAVLLAGAGPAAAQLSPEQSLKKMKPAEGFEIALWASEPMVRNVTGIDIDSRGRVWVAEGLNYRLTRNHQFHRLPGADRILILEDTKGTGKADKVTVFADNIFPVPMGIAVQEIWKDGRYKGAKVYVGNSPNLLVLEDTKGDDHADRRYPLLSGFGGVDSDHGVHGMVLGPDGKLYFTHGDGCCSVSKDRRSESTRNFDVIDRSGRHLRGAGSSANTLRVNLDGTQLETICDHQRNNYETCLNSFGQSFSSDNDDDGNRGCRMIWCMDGGNYGYHTPGSPRHWGEDRPGIVPKLVGTGNGAPCGILVYEGDLFPPEYRGSVLQVDAGTHHINFHPLQRRGGAFRTDYKVLLDSSDTWFRPVDAAVAPDGSLVIGDWYDAGVGGHAFTDQSTGRIYRMVPRGAQPRPEKPDFATVAGLVRALQSPVVATRFVARQGLIDRGAAARGAVEELFRSGKPEHRARALWVLAALGGAGRPAVLAALKDHDPRIRAQAIRILARDVSHNGDIHLVGPDGKDRPAWPYEPRGVKELDHILPLAEDPDPGVRRELILAIRDIDTAKVGGALWKLVAGWDGQDRWSLEALNLALRNRDPAYIRSLVQGNLFGDEARPAEHSGPVALPPYYPVTSNEAFPSIEDRPLPATPLSKRIGLAWELHRPEVLPMLGQVMDRAASPALLQAADDVVRNIADLAAGEFVVQRFLGATNPGRRRQLLAILGSRLANEWRGLWDRPSLRQVIQQGLGSAELRAQTVETIINGQGLAFAPQLLQIAGQADGDLALRVAAIKGLGRLGAHDARPLLDRFIQSAAGKDLADPMAVAALEAWASLAGSQADARLEQIIGADSYPLALRKQAVRSLADRQGGALRLLDLARSNKLADELKPDVMMATHSSPDPRVRDLAEKILPLPRLAQGRSLPPLAELLRRPGDPERGREVFFRRNVPTARGSTACAACHRVQGQGESIGPDLSTIGTKLSRAGLLDAILNPSGNIAFGFTTYAVATRDGRVFSGLVAEDTPQRLVLKTAQGERIVLQPGDVEERRAQAVSLMPDGLAETMTDQQLVDLLSFLETLRKPVSVVGQYYVLGPLRQAESRSGFDPSSRPNLQAAVRGAGGKVQWQRMEGNKDGTLDLTGLLGLNSDRVVYLYLPVVTALAQDARVVLDAPAAHHLEAWLDGRAVQLSRPTDPATPGGRTQEVQVHLPRGSSQLVIRIDGGQAPTTLVTTLVTEEPIQYGFDSAVSASTATSRR